MSIHRTPIAVSLVGQQDRIEAVAWLDELLADDLGFTVPSVRRPVALDAMLAALRHDLAAAEITEAAVIARAEMAVGIEAQFGDPPDEDERS